MATQTITSKQFTLDLADLGKGFLVSGVSAALTALYSVINSGTWPTVADAKTIGLVALTAGVSYLVKNFFTPAQVVTPLNS